MNNISKGSNFYLFGLAIVAAMGGFLFGYDTAIISGTLSFVKTQFSLNSIAEGWYVSSAIVGCILGVAGAGFLSDKFGRKLSLLLAAFLFFVSALGCAITPSQSFLIVARLIGGMGVGIASMLSPLYISEISPPRIRGRLVALYQFAITLGILFAYFANSWLVNRSVSGDLAYTGIMDTIFVSEVWRGMLGSETIPALLFFILVLMIPESPRWLTLKGQEVKARYVLTRVNGSQKAKAEIESIKATIGEKAESLKVMAKKGYLFPLIIGAALALLTQVSGINAIIYYGPSILNEAGFKLSDALGGQVIIGITNVVFTLIAIWKIDQIGRRPLLIFGVSGILVFLITIGFLFFFGVDSGYLLLVFILLFIACFAFSYGPVIWVLLAEIYPTRYRGRAMSVATLTLWVGTTFVGQMTPWFLENLKPHGTFWLFALMTLPALYISIKLLPETKGKTLEEIEKFWVSRKKDQT